VRSFISKECLFRDSWAMAMLKPSAFRALQCSRTTYYQSLYETAALPNSAHVLGAVLRPLVESVANTVESKSHRGNKGAHWSVAPFHWG
jgi:hypothetical protein